MFVELLVDYGVPPFVELDKTWCQIVVAEAAAALQKAAGECAILFLSPVYADALSAEIAVYDGMVTPAILPLPEADGGIGMRNLKKYVERAVGADILFKD